MYQPASFVVEDRAVVLDALRHLAFGHLVTADAEFGIQATGVPFLVDDELTTIRAHLARANRQWRSIDGADALLIVPGVDTYVSPRWYPSKADDPRVVPTWNYELIHVRGTVRVVEDGPGKLEIVRDLTDHHEALSLSADAGVDGPAWEVGDAPDAFIERQLRAIVGLELTIESIEAKRKLSQNRSEPDRLGVRAALAASPDDRSRVIGQQMTD